MPTQLDEEFKKVIDLVLYVFGSLGFENFTAQVSLRDPEKPEKYIGSDENWDLAETAIINAAKEKNLNYVIEYGEAAFYGPKIDFVVKDVLGREWQLGTVQVDYNLPERFDLSYVGPDGEAHRPVMIHRAPFGSMERFVGVLIEHFGGAFPTWLSPLQVMVVSVAEAFSDYADEIVSRLRNKGIRIEHDASSLTMGKKIRNASVAKVPNVLVVGEREQTERTVTLRCHGSRDQHTMSLDDFEARLMDAVIQRKLSLL